VAQKLSDAIDRIVHLPDVSAKIEALGLQVVGSKPEAFQKVVRADAAIARRSSRTRTSASRSEREPLQRCVRWRKMPHGNLEAGLRFTASS